MKKIILVVVSILLVSTLLSGCGKTYTQGDIDRLVRALNREIERADENEEDLNDQKKLNNEQLATITHLEAEVARKDSEIYSLTSDNSNKDKKISSLEEEISQKNELLSSLDSEVSVVDSLQSELSKKEEEVVSLQSEICKKEEEISGLKKDLQNASSSNQTTTIYVDSSSYLAQKFWLDGNEYYTNGVTWYSDITCKTEATSVTIISPTVDTFVQSNGYTVYVCMTKYGLVYSSNYPYLLTYN